MTIGVRIHAQTIVNNRVAVIVGVVADFGIGREVVDVGIIAIPVRYRDPHGNLAHANMVSGK